MTAPIIDPLSVACPTCQADGPPNPQPCRMAADWGGQQHADRYDAARLTAYEPGICDLCGEELHRGYTTDGDLEAVHRDPTHAAACPPIPDPAVDAAGWSAAINAGARPGHPGVEHWSHALDLTLAWKDTP